MSTQPNSISSSLDSTLDAAKISKQPYRFFTTTHWFMNRLSVLLVLLISLDHSSMLLVASAALQPTSFLSPPSNSNNNNNNNWQKSSIGNSYEDDCRQLNKWATFLRTKIDPVMLEYALSQCRIAAEEQQRSGQFYDDFDYGSHNLFVRSSNGGKNEKKGLGEVIRFGKRDPFKREGQLGKYIRFGRKKK